MVWIILPPIIILSLVGLATVIGCILEQCGFFGPENKGNNNSRSELDRLSEFEKELLIAALTSDNQQMTQENTRLKEKVDELEENVGIVREQLSYSHSYRLKGKEIEWNP